MTAFCPGCGQPAGEAAFCSICGTALTAAPVPPPVAPSGGRAIPRWVWFGGGAAVLGLGALVAVQTGMVPVGALDGAALEAQLEEDLGRTFDGSVQVDCPASIPQQKNRITDCDVRLPSGREGQVFIEQVDAGGHFRFQVESGVAAAEIEEQIEEDVETATAQAERDAAELTKQIERDTEAAVAALPRQAFVDTCEGAYTADVCDCIFDALGAKDAQDEALVGFLAEQPTAAATKAAGGCGG